MRHPSRRRFFQTAAAGAAASLTCLGSDRPVAMGSAPDDERSGHAFQLALASYTLRKFDLDQTLAMTQQVGLGAICLKSFHLPLDSTPEQIAAAAAKVEQAGVVLYGGGVITMKNEQQVDDAFEYAKAAGMTKIIGVPSPEVLPLVDRKVKHYDVQVCIHNHGPGDKTYPLPSSAYEKIRNLDPRIGLCIDIGHTVRAGGDLLKEMDLCADRILDVHCKDVTEATAKGRATVAGRGVIDLVAFLRKLIEIDYSGFVSFEYEESPDDPLAGLAQSVGYVQGVLAVI